MALTLGRVWLVANQSSRSTDADGVAALCEALAAAGAEIAGNSDFPDQPAPDAATLSAAGIATLVVMGGDGTINSASETAAGWDGAVLAVPGGTMNLLPRALHGEATPAEIVARAGAGELVRVPTLTAQGRRSFCRVILGPMTRWALTRETARRGRLWRFVQAVRLGLARGFAGGVAVAGRPGRYAGVLVLPRDKGLEVATFAGTGVIDALAVGLKWLTGDWREASAVDAFCVADLTVGRRNAVRALFDGEACRLAAPARLVPEPSPLLYIRTCAPDAAA